MRSRHLQFLHKTCFIMILIVMAGILSVQKSNAQCIPTSVNWTVTPQNLKCFNDSSGSIAVNIIGGSPNFAFSLYSAIQNPILVNNYPLRNYTFTNLKADSNYYLVVQIPIGGGNFAFCSQSIIISQPAAVTITPTSITNVTCNGGNNGAINVNITGGTNGPYTYSWSNGATTQNLPSLTAGTYTLTAKDANGCKGTATYTITQPTPIAESSTTTNITCNGGNNGAITINSVTGGTSPYTYLWSNGATTQSIPGGLSAGNYTSTVTDSKNCSKVFSYTVTQPLPIAVTQTVTNASCNGTSTGSITINTVSGGTGPYTYSWSNGATTQSISGIPAGNYTLTITDNKNCTNIFNYTITQPASITATSVITDVPCTGPQVGSISITPSGGTTPYSYLWSNGAVTQNISNVPGGTYTVTITDSKNCSSPFTYTISPSVVITVTPTIQNASCFGSSNGSITLTPPSGGTAPYSYLWSNGAVTQNISGLIAGNYSVTITDSKGCHTNYSYAITQPTAIGSVASITNSCNGSASGSINLTASGGTSPYTYLWSNGAVTQNVSGLLPGVYTVTVTDSKNCSTVFSDTVKTETIKSTAVITNATCLGTANGDISITPSGGVAPYTYIWSNGASTQNISNIIA